MFIQTEDTPNPNTLKFFPGSSVINGGPVNILSEEAAQSYRISKMLWGINGVCGIMLGYDFVSVSKLDDADWEILKPQIFATIVEYFTLADNQEEEKAPSFEDDQDAECHDEISQQIKEIIQEKVRPAVMQDGGNVVFKGYEDGVVYLKLQGACSGCPSAAITLKDGIENMLQYYVPQVKCVQQV